MIISLANQSKLLPDLLVCQQKFWGIRAGNSYNPYRTLELAHDQSTNRCTIFYLSSGVHEETNIQILNRKVLLRLAKGNTASNH